jgi:hypothetical protein
MLRVDGDRRGLSHLCPVERPLRQRQTGRGVEEYMTLSRQWKTLSIRVLHFLDWMTEQLLENVSYEKPCYARHSLNIPLDGVADGTGEAARRRPKSFFHDFCVMMGPNGSAKILAPKRSGICSIYSLS